MFQIIIDVVIIVEPNVFGETCKYNHDNFLHYRDISVYSQDNDNIVKFYSSLFLVRSYLGNTSCSFWPIACTCNLVL